MALRHIEELEDYSKYLQENRNEVEALYQDILINVTSFFRDPAAFEALQEKVYPEILKDRAPAETIRIWVPGCSTGEEAYSHAISLLEFVTQARAEVSVQILGPTCRCRPFEARARAFTGLSIRATFRPT